MPKKLNKVERFLLENTGADYQSYRCAAHGVFQQPHGPKNTGKCWSATCTAVIEQINNPAEYALNN